VNSSIASPQEANRSLLRQHGRGWSARSRRARRRDPAGRRPLWTR